MFSKSSSLWVVSRSALEPSKAVVDMSVCWCVCLSVLLWKAHLTLAVTVVSAGTCFPPQLSLKALTGYPVAAGVCVVTLYLHASDCVV